MLDQEKLNTKLYIHIMRSTHCILPKNCRFPSLQILPFSFFEKRQKLTGNFFVKKIISKKYFHVSFYRFSKKEKDRICHDPDFIRFVSLAQIIGGISDDGKYYDCIGGAAAYIGLVVYYTTYITYVNQGSPGTAVPAKNF